MPKGPTAENGEAEVIGYAVKVMRIATNEQVVIVRVGKLVPVEVAARKRQLGGLAGTYTVPADFDAPLPDAVLDTCDGR